MKKILIVEDEKNILDSIAMYLEGHGYGIIKSPEGIDAIKLAKDQLPDMILLDLLLPDMDGSLICRTLKENEVTSRIPVIIISAISQEEKIKELQDLGASDYLVKPFDPSELLGTIEKNLKEKN